jgi:Fibronectin type III domain
VRFSLVVTDQFGAVSAPAYVLVSVGSNQRPIANAGPDQTPGRGKVVTLDGSGSTDPEATTITYQWVQTDASGSPILPGDPLQVTLSSSTAQKPTFTAPIPTVFPKDLFFRLFVTDASGSLSDPDAVVIHLVASNAPIADAGAAQVNKATNSTVTLNSTASSDPDSDPITRAWTQIDPITNVPLAPGDPTAVTLSSSTAVSPTFVAPHFAASTTLKFQLVVTDSPSLLASAPAFTTVQINANRAPAVGTPTSSGTKTVGGAVTITVPASAADADGDPVAGFTYQWIQTASATDTTSCGGACPIASVVTTPVSGTPRSATFTAPAFTAAGASLFFRLNVTDGFGATVQSANLTVALSNSAPVVPATMQIRAGIDGSVVNPTRIYVGDSITVSAPSTDADGGALTYAWSGRPCGGLGESLGCLLAGNNDSGYPGGSCRGITITNDPVTPGKASFTGPSFGSNNPNRCGLRLVVTDAFGGTATRDFPILDLIANNAPVAVIGAVPDKVQASTPAATSTLALVGSGSTDADTNPAQPHSYTWEQVDATTGVPVPSGDPSRGTFTTPNSPNTGWVAPSTAPYTVKFRLSVSDGMSAPGVATTPPISITTTRPAAFAGSDRVLHPGQQAILDGTGSSDPGGRPITYSWKELSGPPVTLTGSLTATATFTTPHLNFGDPSQVFVFELTTRNGLTTSFDQMTVVNDPFGRAVASAGANQSVSTGTTGVTLDGSGSTTPSPGTLTYAWTQTGGPSVTLSSATDQKPAFTAPAVSQAQGPQQLTFSLVVADGFSTSEASTTTVTVGPNLEAPYAPTAVTVVRGNATAAVTFTPGIDGGSPVIVYVVNCTSSNGGVARGGYSSASGVTLTGLTNGKSYSCKVQGVNSVGIGPSSDASASFIPSAPPATPTNVTSVTGSGSATVNFTPGANGGEPFVIYVVICDSSNGGVSAGGYFGPGPITVTGLTNGKTYGCHVLAAHALGTSAWSPYTPNFVVGVPAVVDAPTAVPGSSAATVTWVAPSNNGAPITSYVVTPYIGATAQTPVSFPSSATSLSVAGLANGTTYTFTVKALNSRGVSLESPKSAPVTVGVPSAPPVANAAPGNATASVSWTAPANNGSAITGYKVTPFIGAVAQSPVLFAGTATSQVVTGLTNGTTYTFAVSAVNARGTGAATTTGTVLVGAPTAPPLVTATAGAGQATVTWAAPANNGSAITGYTVTPVKAGVAQAPIAYNTSTLTRTITGLTPGASYVFRVTATNARGVGPIATSNAVSPT